MCSESVQAKRSIKAILTDQKAVEKFTDIFSYFSPGEAKALALHDLQTAIDWLSIKDAFFQTVFLQVHAPLL
jgi:hypothetical protein